MRRGEEIIGEEETVIRGKEKAVLQGGEVLIREEQEEVIRGGGEISSNLYRASVCDMKKGTFVC